MLRSFYRCLLRLHPSGFRQRFADEMLSIFDHSVGRPAAVRLLMDAVVSLTRQWTLRPEFWHEGPAAQQAAPDGVPSFCSLDPFRPRTGAVIQGLLLSTVLFFLICFAIRYSGVHVLHVRIPEARFENQQSIRQDSGAAEGSFEKPTALRSQSAAAIDSSVANSSVPARARHQDQASDTQNRASHSSATPNAQREAVIPVAKSQTKLQKKSVRSPHVSPATPEAQAQLQPDMGTAADQSQAQQLISQEAAGTTVQAASEVGELDGAARDRVIRGAVADLNKYYVDPGVAQKMADALLVHEKNGDDDVATDGAAFADLLTKQMRDISHDRYLMMVYSAVPTPANPPALSQAPSNEEVALYRKEMERTNCSIEKLQILPHNIGYLKFNQFPDASICGTRVAAAMASLNHADAIIFDLRDNPGGYANMVALIATYLFDRPTHLNDFYDRGENSTEQSWTLPPVPGNRLADKPVFVLTSHSTFSAAEGFSYDLKMLKRATLVGETTSGRGHMGMGHRIDDHFTIRVPGVKVVNPISNTNWEGTGVEPDVKVRSAEALKTARKLAEKKLQQN
jgi:hypothetical protein